MTDAYGLLSDVPAMQPLLAALRTAQDDSALKRFMASYAVLFTDLSGFSAHPILAHALQRVLRMEEMIAAVMIPCGGTLLKALGDSFLLLFSTVEQAVICVEVAREAMPDNPFCAGIGYGPVLPCRHAYGRTDAFGYEVSAASRLGEDVATGRQTLLSPDAYAQLPPAIQARCEAGQAGLVQYWELHKENGHG